MIHNVDPQLNQWDCGRIVKVSDSNATHVHFANQGDSKAVIIEITNGEAKIPDYLLQTGKAVFAYAVLNGVTLESRSFSVHKREKPESYVYEDDQRNYIYALIANAETATQAANSAANAANAAAESANAAAESANAAAESANAAAEDARAAAEEAREAAADVPVEVNSWEMVQQLVRLGVANKVFSIGDQLVCNHKLYGTLVWDIIGIDHDTPVNTKYKHSLTIQLHDCIDLTTFQFDAPEPTNPNKDRQTYGSNNWLESGIRQWLNSDGGVGNWWEAKTEYDVKPSFADFHSGFLKGLDADFLSVIGKVSKITALNPVTDGGGTVTSAEKFFLLSGTEVYAGFIGGIVEGVAYPYYTDNSVMSGAGISGDANRIKYRKGKAQFWWLRTPSRLTSRQMWGMGEKGEALVTNAYNSRGVAPACCIV